METESRLKVPRHLEEEVGLKSGYLMDVDVFTKQQSFESRENWWMHSIVNALNCTL